MCIRDSVDEDNEGTNQVLEQEIVDSPKSEYTIESEFESFLQEKNNTVKEEDSNLNDPDVPFQKRRFAEQDNTNETIAENPDLFNYIKSVLKKAFTKIISNKRFF